MNLPLNPHLRPNLYMKFISPRISLNLRVFPSISPYLPVLPTVSTSISSVIPRYLPRISYLPVSPGISPSIPQYPAVSCGIPPYLAADTVKKLPDQGLLIHCLPTLVYLRSQGLGGPP